MLGLKLNHVRKRDHWTLEHKLKSTYWGLDKFGHHFKDGIFKLIYLNENCYCILSQISLKFVHEGLIDVRSELVEIMDWSRTGDIWTNDGLFFNHIYVNRVQSVKFEIMKSLSIQFSKMHIKMSSIEFRPFCLGLNIYRSNEAYIGLFPNGKHIKKE